MLLSLTINKLEQSKDNSNHILYFTNTSILRVNRQYNNNNTESMNFVIMKFNKSFSFSARRSPPPPPADPRFPEVGAPTPRGGRQHKILAKFPKNCMKLKEFGPPGGGAFKILLCRSATAPPPQAQNSSLAFKLYFFLSMKTCLSGSGCECTGKANTPNPTRYPKIVCNKNAFQ